MFLERKTNNFDVFVPFNLKLFQIQAIFDYPFCVQFWMQYTSKTIKTSIRLTIV